MEENYIGAIDNQSEEAKAKNYSLNEVCSTPATPIWIEKPRENWLSFPIRDQAQSGTCFPSNAPILMADFSYKAISKIRLNDVVISHKGDKKKVTHLFKKKWQGNTTLLKVHGIFDKIECTKEHPIYAIKRIKDAKPYNETPQFYQAIDLKKNDWVAVQTSREIRDTTIRDYEKDPEFLWVLGLYLAEGCIDEYKVSFALHKDETDFYEKIKRIMSKFGANVSINKHGENGILVCIYGIEWKKVFSELGGNYCNKKKITERLMFIEPILQMQIINGLMDGDGHYDKRGRKLLVSTSPYLIEQTKTILLRNNIFGFAQKRKEQKGKKQSYALEYSISSRYSFIKDGIMFVQLKSVEIKKSFTRGYVYNFEVEDDNSYIVNSVAVHNCVAQTYATELGIIFKEKYGVWIDFSSAFPYQARQNPNISGCNSTDIYSIFPKIGNVFESFMPSQFMSDEQVMAVKKEPYFNDLAKVYKIARISLPLDFETVASTIQATGKGVMVWFKFHPKEWTNEPFISDKPYTSGHSVTAVDFVLKKGKKYLVIQDSWGLKYADQGLRLISEEYFNARCFLASYLKVFEIQDNNTVPERPKFDGSIISAQRCFKWDGLMAGNIPEIENWGPITRTACIAFQKRYGIEPALGNFGPITKSKLKQIYSS